MQKTTTRVCSVDLYLPGPSANDNLSVSLPSGPLHLRNLLTQTLLFCNVLQN